MQSAGIFTGSGEEESSNVSVCLAPWKLRLFCLAVLLFCHHNNVTSIFCSPSAFRGRELESCVSGSFSSLGSRLELLKPNRIFRQERRETDDCQGPQCHPEVPGRQALLSVACFSSPSWPQCTFPAGRPGKLFSYDSRVRLDSGDLQTTKFLLLY